MNFITTNLFTSCVRHFKRGWNLDIGWYKGECVLVCVEVMELCPFCITVFNIKILKFCVSLTKWRKE